MGIHSEIGHQNFNNCLASYQPIVPYNEQLQPIVILGIEDLPTFDL